MPCPALVAAGRPWGMRNAAMSRLILVHEATFRDTVSGRDHAARKRHSTVSDALAAGAGMGAWRTVLTHFSNRHPTFPVPATALGHPPLQLQLPVRTAEEAEETKEETEVKEGSSSGGGASLGAAVQEGVDGPAGKEEEDADHRQCELSAEVSAYGRQRGIVAMDGLRISERNASRLPAMMPLIQAALAAAGGSSSSSSSRAAPA